MEMEKASEPKITEERKIPIQVFDKKRFLGTVNVKLVEYSDGTAKLFDENRELVATGVEKNDKNKGQKGLEQGQSASSGRRNRQRDGRKRGP